MSLPASNWRLSAKGAPAGPITATGIHLLDLAGSLLGPAASVVGKVKQLGSAVDPGRAANLLSAYRSLAASRLALDKHWRGPAWCVNAKR